MSMVRPDILFLCSAALRRIFLSLGMSILPLSSLRVILLRLLGVKIGRGCYVGFNIYVDTNFPSMIAIGDNVTISHGCYFVTHTMSPVTSPLSRIYQDVKPVVIQDGAWIGMNSLLLPGSFVHSNSMVGAGSVVTGYLPPNHLCVGNPCRAIRKLDL